MAISNTDICNMALGYLGANQIIDIDEGSPEATLCKLHYETVRDSVLAAVNWTFAIKRFENGSPLVEPPVYGYKYQFELPKEVLRVLGLDHLRAAASTNITAPGEYLGYDDDYNWQIEGGRILTDLNQIRYRAIVRVEDPNKFSKAFISCFASALAAEIALPLTNSPQQTGAMTEMYLYKKTVAQSTDGRQGYSRRRRASGFVR